MLLLTADMFYIRKFVSTNAIDITKVLLNGSFSFAVDSPSNGSATQEALEEPSLVNLTHLHPLNMESIASYLHSLFPFYQSWTARLGGEPIASR